MFPLSESAPQVDIRLADGSGAHEGQVEFFVNCDWRKTCGEEWTFEEADVFCRSLGYVRAFALLQDGSAFVSSGNTSLFFDDLKCTGFEDNVTECRIFRYKERTCDSTYGATSISCETGSKPCC